MNLIALVRIVFMLLWSFAFQIMVCELGEWVNNKFELFNETLVQCDWYLLPLELQRMYVMILVISQQQIIVQG